MFTNFTAIDVIGTVEAAALMTFILFVPGYVIGWISNVFLFRERPIFFQCLLSTPLAVSVLPILVYLLGRYRPILWAAFAASWIAFAFVSRRQWSAWFRSNVRLSRHAWLALAFAAAWGAITIFTLVDLQIGKRLYFSVPAFDYAMRVAFTSAATRSIPPANPFFASVPPVALRYHYFWMLICSLVPSVGNIGPRIAMYGGTVWAGIALMSLIGISLQFFLGVHEHLGRKFLIGCGLLFVTGLDIVPTVLLYLGIRFVAPDMEWWNEQITSWPDALLWCPHHVMGLLACLVGFLLVREPGSTKLQRTASYVVAGFAFASAVGLSVLLAFTFALFAALWLPYALLRRYWGDIVGFAASSAVALFVGYPYLRSLLGPAVDGYGGAGRFFAPWVRPFPVGTVLLGYLLKIPNQYLPLLSFPFLPLNYFLELGFFFVVGMLRIRSIRKGKIPMTKNEESAWVMLVSVFFIGSFMRSTTIQSNDLAWRCFLLAQFVLLLWGACVIDEWWIRRQTERARSTLGVRFAAGLLALGALACVYQICMLRIYPLLLDSGKVSALDSATWMETDHHMGERTFDLRSAYERLWHALPQDAVVQYNPAGATYVRNGLYSLHSVAMADPLCGAVFGGSAAVCKIRAASIPPLFEGATPMQNSAVDDLCSEYRIAAIVVADTDLVWRHSDSWVWSRAPFFSDQHVRVVGCGSPEQQALLRAGN